MANIFNSVLIASLWSCCFTILFMLANKIFKKSLSFSWHYYIWLIVVIRLLVPVFISVDVESAQEMISKEALPAEAPIDIIHVIDNPENNEGIQAYSIQTENQIIPLPAKANMLKQFFSMSKLWVIWIVITTIIIANKILSYFFYTAKLRKGLFLPNEDEINIFLAQMKKLGIKKNIVFFKYKGAHTPFAIGLFNPVVIMPDKIYSEMQLDYIFHHELLHIKRLDLGIKWLFEIAKAIHWFNPFVYLAAKNAAFYCEASCDAIVLKNSTESERREYGTLILDLIRQAVHSQILMCVSMDSGKANLKRRIQYILNSGQVKKNMVLSITVTIIIFTICACSSLRPQEISNLEQAPATKAKPETRAYKPDESFVITKEKTNILIAGIDNTGRTDAIIIASFDIITNKISLLSVPRDTYLIPSEETVLELKQYGAEISPEIKFGEIGAYAKDNAMKYLREEIANALGIPIDYYIGIDIPAFENLVDAAGGVTVTIPNDGLYYSDPVQSLEIALDGGVQHLNGEKAMMLARYRATYKNGDLDRINVQQQLLQALYSKIMDSDNIIEKSTALLSILIENTETNLSLKNSAPYIQYIPKIKADSMQAFQLPGESELINGRFYVVINTGEFENSIASIFRYTDEH